jgi:hypothetical protein
MASPFQKAESSFAPSREISGPSAGKSPVASTASRASAGKMTVEIIASRLIPGKFDESNPDEKVPVGEMYIPARYNSETELTADVPVGGTRLDFALTSD